MQEPSGTSRDARLEEIGRWLVRADEPDRQGSGITAELLRRTADRGIRDLERAVKI